jgi:5-methylcytosine-specific restriction endonuclease McrA
MKRRIQNMKIKKNPYERKEVYDIKNVFEILEKINFEGHIKMDGDILKASSLRYKTFHKGHTCVSCGLEGLYFAKERTQGSKEEIYHLNLYGITPEGKEMLMTKDHILPKSKGGTDDLDNLQTMCHRCNGKKGNKTPVELQEKLLVNV